jgi:hypothetical protein
MVGCGDGSVIFFRNEGDDIGPVFGEGEFIIPASSIEKQVLFHEDEPKRGSHSRIHIVDYDRDGKLDVLVGDNALIKRAWPDLSSEELVEFQRAALSYMTLQIRFITTRAKLEMAHYYGTATTEMEREITSELRSLDDQLIEKSQSLSPYCEPGKWTGHIWVFLRK